MSKSRFFILVWFALSTIGCLNAQEQIDQDKKVLKYFGVEAGVDFMGHEAVDYDFIRRKPGYNSNQGYVSSYMNKWYVGVNSEFILKNKWSSLLIGARLTGIWSSFGDYRMETPEIFYISDRQQSDVIEMYSMEEVNQEAYYLGVPFALKIFSQKQGKLIGFYGKAGVDLGFLLTNKMEAHFYNEEMNDYTDEVLQKFDEPSDFFATLNLAVGLSIGYVDKPHLNIETMTPIAFLNNFSTGLVNPTIGGGLQASLMFPF